MKDKKIKREYESKGVSAPPEWWDKVEKESENMGFNNKSLFIRLAVDAFIKKSIAVGNDRPVAMPTG